MGLNCQLESYTLMSIATRWRSNSTSEVVIHSPATSPQPKLNTTHVMFYSPHLSIYICVRYIVLLCAVSSCHTLSLGNGRYTPYLKRTIACWTRRRCGHEQFSGREKSAVYSKPRRARLRWKQGCHLSTPGMIYSCFRAIRCACPLCRFWGTTWTL